MAKLQFRDGELPRIKYNRYDVVEFKAMYVDQLVVDFVSGDFQAVKSKIKALGHNPEESEIYKKYGYALLKRGHDPQALPFLKKALELEPLNMGLMQNILGIKLRLKNEAKRGGSIDVNP